MDMMWMTVPFPLRFVHNVYGFAISYLTLIYNIVMWPFCCLFHGGGNESSTGNALSTSSYFADFSSINDLVNSFLLKLSESSQDAVHEILLGAWTIVKNQLLPVLDHYMTIAAASDYVPEDIRKYLQDLHSLYSILHIIGIL